MKNLQSKILKGILVSFLFASTANAGYIVANNDEWTFSNAGYTNAGGNNADNFINNITHLFTGDQTGNFLAYSNNFGLNQSNLANSITSDGHSWTTSTNISFDLATLSTYDGIFFAGYGANNAFPNQQVIIDYLAQGGNVYIGAGTGNGGATGEANAWNAVMAKIGLSFETPYNGISGSPAPVGPDPLIANVDNLYFSNGNTIVDNDPNNSTTNGEIFFSLNGQGMLAVGSFGELPPESEYTPNNVVPEPTTLAIFALGILGLVSRRKFK